MRHVLSVYRWALYPSLTRGGRDVIGMILLGQGLIRLIDGRLFAMTQLNFVQPPVWGIAQFLMGVALCATGTCRWRHTTGGRTIASLAAGLLTVMAVAAYHVSVPSTWTALVMAYYCLIEAGVRECE